MHGYEVMWAEAIFTLTDCEDFVSSMTPLELVIDDGLERRLFVDRPTRVELIAEKGIAIETSARLCWSVVGITVPVTIPIARVLLMPSIETRDGHDALVFALHIESADGGLPDLVETSITSHVNDRLQQMPVVWSFMKTLDFHFDLPRALQPLRHVDLAAKWGQVRVTDDALVLAISFQAAAISTPLVSVSQFEPANSQNAIH